MAEPYCGEIRLFAGNYAPAGWSLCDGSLLRIDGDTQQLYAYIGKSFGGDGVSTFALPDLRGRAPISAGRSTAPPNNVYKLAQTGGAETVALTIANIPPHTHQASVSAAPATTQAAASNTLLAAVVSGPGQQTARYLPASSPVGLRQSLRQEAITSAGAGHPLNNVMPSIALNYIIAVQGLTPPTPG